MYISILITIGALIPYYYSGSFNWFFLKSKILFQSKNLLKKTVFQIQLMGHPFCLSLPDWHQLKRGKEGTNLKGP